MSGSITDSMVTVFSVSGLTAVLQSYLQVQNAQNRLNQANGVAAPAGGPGYAVLNAQNTAMAAHVTAFGAAQQAASRYFGAVFSMADMAIRRYKAMAGEIMNVSALTGASMDQSAKLALLFKASGISDQKTMLQIARLSNTMTTTKGKAALGKLGIVPSGNDNGVKSLLDVATALSGMKDGMRKTGIEAQLFGTRNTAAFQMLLKMTNQERAAIGDLSDGFTVAAMAGVRQFTVQSELLSETVTARLVGPIVNQMMPVLIRTVGWLAKGVSVVGRLNQAMGGTLAWVGAFAIAAVGAALLFNAVGKGIVVLVELRKALQAAAVVQAFITALSGPRGIALVVGAAAVSGLAIAGISHFAGGGSGGGSPAADKISSAAETFSDAVDQFAKHAGRGVPHGISEMDIASLSRQGALGAIG